MNIQRGGTESDDGKTLAACRSHGSEQSDEQAGRTPARAAPSFEERVKAEVSMWTKVGTEPPSLGRFDLTVRRMLQAEDNAKRLRNSLERIKEISDIYGHAYHLAFTALAAQPEAGR